MAMESFLNVMANLIDVECCHIGVWVNKPKLIFFIPDANLTSIISLRYPLPKHRIRTASSYRATSVVQLVKTLLCCKGRGFESHPSNMPVIFFSPDSGESTQYAVLTHIGVWVNKPKLIFFIPDANLTSIIMLSYFSVLIHPYNKCYNVRFPILYC